MVMRPSIWRPQSALAGTFDASGIVVPPRLLNAHGARCDRRRAPPGLSVLIAAQVRQRRRSPDPAPGKPTPDGAAMRNSTCVSRIVTRT